MTAPSSTYRVQVRPGWTLADAAALTGYLRDLGAGAVYCSPLLRAATGSDHGYDVVDPRVMDDARGGEDGWRALLAAAREHGLGVVVDIVPNHQGVGDPSQNPAWQDVLRLGPSSAYAGWFDVDWAAGRLLLPVLDKEGGFSLADDGDALVAGGLRFPLAPGTGPRPGDSAADVHDRQFYDLADARRADDDLTYRRFFAVTSLAGVRVEDPEVAAATHERILRWVRDDGVDGLRVDHPDGLADPGGYLRWLRGATSPETWLLVEKILEPATDETLPDDWPVDGTTGYDALAEVGPLFVDPAAEPALDRLYRELTGDELSFAVHVLIGKRAVATTILRSEFHRLARLAPDVPEAFAALSELAFSFPVYRSYLPSFGTADLDTAFAKARARRRNLTAAFDALAPRLADPDDELCVRFQQVTGAVTAKGVEDTAYYRYTRFVALNEVGGDPRAFGLGLDEFHAAQERRQQRAPSSMTTLSTHDTKRGEDVRAWLAVLAEIPDEWAELVRRLAAEAPMPDRPMSYLLWQTVVGFGLDQPERLHAYATKAMREAWTFTGWADPDEELEAEVHAALDALADRPDLRAAVDGFIERIRPFGWSNALGQKLVQLTMPGVPDVYQGTEGWDDSLVDPDNRRPVDFARLRALLANETPPEIDASGAAKVWVVSRALRLRRDRPELFTSYERVPVRGPAADHAIAFDRGGAITVATRLPVGLASNGGWADTVVELPDGLTDVLTGRPVDGGPVPLAGLLGRYPAALLVPPA
ncbi:malto-oligosyltrehalose synthase [Jiangella mangrovi]|uniref:(1->4)-alpha-D-glucan 1-alpha-D-glucosylmutase n=1 Tax=Jiangella mangrovi TaxID=1524084 RepID=A0A7W9GTA1_9ACTN|nr:malto-oligosyltrehalose synthase [Jiangella mangrovi]MBB5789346.1 (1->4)-alpha-D-glucan 1-alpha-D-glucosylmutase [Jiangella mangrovi]